MAEFRAFRSESERILHLRARTFAPFTSSATGSHFGADSQVALAAPVVLAISWVIATSGLHIDYSRAEGLAITFNKEAVSSDDQGKALPDFLKSLPKPSLAAGS
jgi:hypothetical protein